MEDGLCAAKIAKSQSPAAKGSPIVQGCSLALAVFFPSTSVPSLDLTLVESLHRCSADI
jgi:hypothetical protein